MKSHVKERDLQHIFALIWGGNNMKKLFALLLGLMILASFTLPAHADEPLVISCEDAIAVDSLPQERDSAWDDYCRTMLSDPVVQSESADCAMTYGDGPIQPAAE